VARGPIRDYRSASGPVQATPMRSIGSSAAPARVSSARRRSASA